MIQSNPNSNLAASEIISRLQTGSNTISTVTAVTFGTLRTAFSTSCTITGPMPHPGAVKVMVNDCHEECKSNDSHHELNLLRLAGANAQSSSCDQAQSKEREYSNLDDDSLMDEFDLTVEDEATLKALPVPLSSCERERLITLRQTRILDSSQNDPEFDAIVTEAAKISMVRLMLVLVYTYYCFNVRLALLRVVICICVSLGSALFREFY